MHYLVRTGLQTMTKYCTRQFQSGSQAAATKGLIVGVHYDPNQKSKLLLSKAAEKFNQLTNGKLLQNIDGVKDYLSANKCFTFWDLHDSYKCVGVVNLGAVPASDINVLENLNEKKDVVRRAAATGCRTLESHGIANIEIEAFDDAESAAEGSILSTWKFQEFKSKKERETEVSLMNDAEPDDRQKWETGAIKARAQNFARFLAEMPANVMTPGYFADKAAEQLRGLDNVRVSVYDGETLEKMCFSGLLAVAKGSQQSPKFVEIHYDGGATDGDRFVLIGKGVTFDSGGISIKPSTAMNEMRADMGGAAVVLATVKALAQIRVPLNLTVLIPLCENMPSGSALKPGDIIKTMSGKSICVDNTDAEGRLILSDALTYSAKFEPKAICDVATLTGAMRIALGHGTASGAFSNNDRLWQLLSEAGAETGDRVWRFPLWNCYTKMVSDYRSYDVNNVGKGKGGGACTAAAFLRQFVPENRAWLHLDIAAVMGPRDLSPYMGNEAFMTGRPTRTLVQFYRQMAANHDYSF